MWFCAGKTRKNAITNMRVNMTLVRLVCEYLRGEQPHNIYMTEDTPEFEI